MMTQTVCCNHFGCYSLTNVNADDMKHFQLTICALGNVQISMNYEQVYITRSGKSMYDS